MTSIKSDKTGKTAIIISSGTVDALHMSKFMLLRPCFISTHMCVHPRNGWPWLAIRSVASLDHSTRGRSSTVAHVAFNVHNSSKPPTSGHFWFERVSFLCPLTAKHTGSTIANIFFRELRGHYGEPRAVARLGDCSARISDLTLAEKWPLVRIFGSLITVTQ